MKTSLELLEQILQETAKVVIGKDTEIKLALSAFLSGSHLLIEDIPGVGKTTLAKTLAHVLGLKYSRVQFTNDLLPSDIVGLNIYNVNDASFSFKKGPIFSEFLLADEINRASSKTQSALLEAMEEKHVSVDGTTHSLPQPFFVVATKNPFEEVGTYELPSSQLDRFALSLSLGYPTPQAEREIFKNNQIVALESLKSLSQEEVLHLLSLVDTIHLNEDILDLLQEILHFTRTSGLYVTGLSTRAAINLLRLSKAWAILQKRDYVIPSDVLDVLPYICRHRLHAKGHKKTELEIVDAIIKNLHIDT